METTMLFWIHARLDAAATRREARRTRRAALELEAWHLRDVGLTRQDLLRSR
jgi:uncharacterized protein YjiS (DUF1127 family)